MWDYLQPVKIHFGNGRVFEIEKIVKEMGYSNGLLISTPHFCKSGLSSKILEKSNGILSCVFSELSPNPDVEEVDKCAELIRKNNIDFIVVLGGGSAIDLAKAVSVIGLTDDSIRKYHGTGISVPDKHLPLIAIPTTSGTGSEVTSVSVLSDHKNGKKAPIVSDSFYPVCAIIDPELTYSVPSQITAATGIDVLSHAIEGYWSKGHQPICDACALYASKLVFENLYKCYKEPENKVAREKMAEASVIAGLAFTLPKTTSSHACSFPLTNIYNIPHGEACGLTLDYFVRINGSSGDSRILYLANELGFDTVELLADAILDLKKKMNLRTDLKDFNISDDEIDELVRLSRHPNLYNNPVDITDEQLREMYESMR